jgi:hypothetical protein
MANPFKRRPIDVRNCTLLELAQAKTGSMLKAARVVAFVVGWETVRRDLGREPTVDEYAAWWKEDRATAYRHLALFRTVFDARPDIVPGEVLDHFAAQRRSVTDRFDFAGGLAA